ncbi:thiamine pyrophosphate-binding protein [Spiractinospora alimapuensis]|uniref:thiamine pyrophosphate-binding protein n=1 Tax=Spiractinospora alimapuensis TaxID=2820884 RepID=UPI001F3EC389|nr:thiamine pyrophosphate-dependent enzyme [Spiractinospora alimapuensis]QVQ50909.1 thiamine pyrophosphate-binding protein [Spiractinospora alimapuensis]
MSRTLADDVIDMVRGSGADVVFTCPGTTEVPILDAALDHPECAMVLTTHESVAVAAADGYARSTGHPGVALLHANVGLLNGLSMAEAARVGNSRVLVLNGTKPLANRNRRGFTQTPGSPHVARPFAVWAGALESRDSALDDLRAALLRLQRNPAGPVYLELPQDLLARPALASVPTITGSRDTATCRPTDSAIAEASAALAASSRVVLVAGREVADTSAAHHLVAISRLLHAPLFEAPWRELERETIDTADPHYAGVLSWRPDVLAGATALVVGTPPFLEPDADNGMLDACDTVIHVSSDPTDVISPSLPLVGAPVESVEALLKELSNVDQDPRSAAARASWLREVTSPAPQGGTEAAPSTEALSVGAVARIMAEDATDQSPVVVDAVTATGTLLRGLPRRPGRQFHATGSGALGWGMGAAIGVAHATDGRVHAIVSDGVFQFGLQALHTAVAKNLPITWVVLNNRSYRAVKLALENFGGRARAAETFPCTDLGDSNLAMIAEGYGVAATRVTSESAFARAWREQRSVDGPRLIEVMVDSAERNTAR